MKIVNLDTFLQLPDGILFAKYNDGAIEELCIKEGSIHETGDFFYQDLLEIDANDSDEREVILMSASSQGTTFDLDLDCVCRDGLFEPYQLFLVFEEADTEKLIARLQGALQRMTSTIQKVIDQSKTVQ